MPNQIVLAFSLLILTAGATFAQEPATSLRGQDRDPHMPAPSQTVPEKRGEGPVTVTNDKGQTLSGKPDSGTDPKK